MGNRHHSRTPRTTSAQAQPAGSSTISSSTFRQPGSEQRGSESETVRTAGWIAPGWNLHYVLLCLAVAAQGITIAITWPVWTIRQYPVSIPLFAEAFWDSLAVHLPSGVYGWLVVGSLAVVLVRPRWGGSLQLAMLLIACFADQFRMQPQFLFLAVVILLLTHRAGDYFLRWILISLWIWAGLHKLLSPEWIGTRAFGLLDQLGWVHPDWYLWFAIGIGSFELLVGLIALRFYRITAVLCLMMHFGISLFLSPLALDYNYSVIPWNLLVGVLGAVLFWKAGKPNTTQLDDQEGNRRTVYFNRIKMGFAATVLIYPAFFYVGWVDHGISYVLYSGMLPQMRITVNQDSPWDNPVHGSLRGWGPLNIPFPDERRTLLAYFRRAAPEGSKCHLFDPRPTLPDGYYLKTNHGIVPLSQRQFFSDQPSGVIGQPFDDPAVVFHMIRQGHDLLSRHTDGSVYAIRIVSSGYQPADLPMLVGLPGLEQIQLADCPVTDTDFATLPVLENLQAIGLNDTQVTDASIPRLRMFPKLESVYATGTRLTRSRLIEAGFQVPR